MKSPLSQEYIHIPEEDRICLTEVIDRAHPSQVSSSVQDLTVYDLQLRKVITPSSELRFGCSLTLWKAHLVKNPSIYILLKFELILNSENQS